MMNFTHAISRLDSTVRALGIAALFILLSVGCAECEVDYDCPGNEICKVSVGQCAAVECSANQDCPPDRHCARNQCVASQQESTPDEGDALVLESVP